MSFFNKLLDGLTSNTTHFQNVFGQYIETTINENFDSELRKCPDGLVPREFNIPNESPLIELKNLVGKINFLSFLEMSYVSFRINDKLVQDNLVSQFDKLKSQDTSVRLSSREFQNSINSISKHFVLLDKQDLNLGGDQIYMYDFKYSIQDNGQWNGVIKSFSILCSYYCLIGIHSSGKSGDIVNDFIKNEIKNFSWDKLSTEKTIEALFSFHRKKGAIPNDKLDYLYFNCTLSSLEMNYDGYIDYLTLPLVYNGCTYDQACTKVLALKERLVLNDKDWDKHWFLSTIFLEVNANNHLEIFKTTTPRLFELFYQKE